MEKPKVPAIGKNGRVSGSITTLFLRSMNELRKAGMDDKASELFSEVDGTMPRGVFIDTLSKYVDFVEAED
jgi:hypothetical protein